MTSNTPSGLGRAKRLAQKVNSRSKDNQPTGPDMQGALEEVTARLNRQHARIATLEREVARISPQVAASEIRIEDLRERLDRPEFEDTDRAEAASLVEEIRREHQRIRARISSATRYEERLRQVEAAVSELALLRQDSPS